MFVSSCKTVYHVSMKLTIIYILYMMGGNGKQDIHQCINNIFLTHKNIHLKKNTHKSIVFI